MACDSTTYQDQHEETLAWMQRLKDAHDAGYYRTESAVGQQSPIPWQERTCQHCSSWTVGYCDVHAAWRDASHVVCPYFSETKRSAIQPAEVKVEKAGLSRLKRWFTHER